MTVELLTIQNNQSSVARLY